ncbi:MAG: ribonuclease P protein component [Saprospiraceae bacterium]|nr:ribonuclease P protein component [Saprospiraceae bacterium]
MSQKIPKEQKLKSDNQIQFLFNKGKSIFFYPIKMQYYLQSETTERKGLQFGVSVSKNILKSSRQKRTQKKNERGFPVE